MSEILEESANKEPEKENVYESLDSSNETKLGGPESNQHKPGKKAEKFLSSAEGVLLTAEEKAMLEDIAKRIDAKEEKEAAEESQKSPENIIIGRLSKAAERLESEGLAEDAKIMRDKINSINELIDLAAKTISSNPAEYSWFSGNGNKDTARLDMLMRRVGKIPWGTNPTAINICADAGEGLVYDRALNSLYKIEDVDKYKEQIEKMGGLEPSLSERGLQLLLEEVGIINENETPLKFSDEKMNNGKFIGQRKGSHENGQYPYYYYEKDFDGNIRSNLALYLDRDFIISAALRKIEANKNNQA